MVKPLSLRDILLVAKLQKQGVTLDLEERLLYPRAPVRAAIAAGLMPAMSNVVTSILRPTEDHGAGLAFVQTRLRPGRPEQDIIFVAPGLQKGNGRHALWQRLLAHLCVRAGEMGHQRIYVRLDSAADTVQIFKNVGFLAYAQEDVYLLDPDLRCKQARQALELRRQRPADSWSLQRLYAAVTPQAVQVAEGLAQGQWQVQKSGFPGHRRGYVWENQGEILAVLNVHSSQTGHWLRIMVHPAANAETPSLLFAGLRLLKNTGAEAVYCSLRTYQSELAAHAVTCGFRPCGSQQVMVKHITVRARDFLTRLLPVFERAIEVNPATSSMVPSHQLVNNGKKQSDRQ